MSVYIGAATKPDYSAMQGPCPTGFHVPTASEFQGVKDIMTGLSLTSADDYRFKLHLPLAGRVRQDTVAHILIGSYGWYRTSTPRNAGDSYTYYTKLNSTSSVSSGARNNGYSVRAFKNEYVEPTSSWTVEQGTLGGAGLFWNQTDGLISITDGTVGYTIMDKNLGATEVLTQSGYETANNCGSMFQRGNNYGFSYTSSEITTSSTQVNASNYGPGNYYNSSSFIAGSFTDWSSVRNDNLWGGNSTIPKELKSAYIGDYINRECIIYKMNANSSGNLYAPIGGYAHNGSAGAPYDWNISIDGGTPTRYTGTGTQQGNITLSGYTSGTNHTIKITPVTEAYGWALAFGFAVNPTSRGLITEIVRDGSYMGYAESATNTGDNFRAYQYYGCEQLTSVPDEYMPDTVTTIGVYFRAAQYAGCPLITSSSVESLPNSVSSIGDSFRYWQYLQDTGITEIKGWKDLSAGGTNYRKQQYAMCSAMKTVTVIGDVGYSSSDNTSLQNNYVSTVSVPTAYLSNYKNATAQPWASIDDSKFIGY